MQHQLSQMFWVKPNLFLPIQLFTLSFLPLVAPGFTHKFEDQLVWEVKNGFTHKFWSCWLAVRLGTLVLLYRASQLT